MAEDNRLITQNVWHVVPVNDLEDHLLRGSCKCNPIYKDAGNGGLIIVHNSFDGREGVEWANEILNSSLGKA